MPRTLPAAGFVLALAISLPSAAQLKLPGNGASPAGAAPRAAAPASAPGSSNATQEMEKAGQLAAAGWLTLLDRRDWGTAWETSAQPFRSNVPLANWLEGAPKVRADFGALQDRSAAAVAYKDRIERMPPGDYVTVVFVSKFEQRGEVQELVTTVRERDGRWRVTGYSVR